MIYDKDPFRHRPRESTARKLRHERCVWAARKMTEWPSENGQTAKIRPLHSSGRNEVPLAAESKYHFLGFGTYLGNVGVIASICFEDIHA